MFVFAIRCLIWTERNERMDYLLHFYCFNYIFFIERGLILLLLSYPTWIFHFVTGSRICRAAESDQDEPGSDQREAGGRAGRNQAAAAGSSVRTHHRER